MMSYENRFTPFGIMPFDSNLNNVGERDRNVKAGSKLARTGLFSARKLELAREKLAAVP